MVEDKGNKNVTNNNNNICNSRKDINSWKPSRCLEIESNGLMVKNKGNKNGTNNNNNNICNSKKDINT